MVKKVARIAEYHRDALRAITQPQGIVQHAECVHERTATREWSHHRLLASPAHGVTRTLHLEPRRRAFAQRDHPPSIEWPR